MIYICIKSIMLVSVIFRCRWAGEEGAVLCHMSILRHDPVACLRGQFLIISIVYQCCQPYVKKNNTDTSVISGLERPTSIIRNFSVKIGTKKLRNFRCW